MAGNENGGELLQDAVCRTLAIEMLDGKWPVGESLTLEDVQNRFGISRTVAREVAKTLESMGAVTVRRRVGLVARPFSDWQALNHQVIEWRLHSTQRERQLSSLTELRLAARTGCGGLGGTPRLHRRQGEIPRLRGADAPNRRIKRRGGCRPDQIPRSGRGIPYFDTARKRQRTVRRACRHHRHRAARPCGTRQIPDEAEAGRARRARCGRRRDSEGRHPERARKAMFDIVDEVARALNFF